MWSICRRRRLNRADAEDVGQSVWLRLVDQLDNLREPAALAGWLATTTRRNAADPSAQRSGLLRAGAGHSENIPDDQSGMAEHEPL